MTNVLEGLACAVLIGFGITLGMLAAFTLVQWAADILRLLKALRSTD